MRRYPHPLLLKFPFGHGALIRLGVAHPLCTCLAGGLADSSVTGLAVLFTRELREALPSPPTFKFPFWYVVKVHRRVAL